MAPTDPNALAAILSEAGFVAADEEASELLGWAKGEGALLESALARRLTGEPLAWITGRAKFGGAEVRIDPGVYVPRRQSTALVERAIARLPRAGIAVDLCTGSGAIASALAAAQPASRVAASEIDPRAVACARANGVEAYRGDLFDPLPQDLIGRVGVITGALPYVPTPDLRTLQRDTFTFETPLSYDGGPDGTDLLRRAIGTSPDWLQPGGALLLELGGDQQDLLTGELTGAGFIDVKAIVDEDGDARGIEATLG